jgi:hypothetical protein
MGDNWRTLHVLPAETHAVEIERELARDSERMRQRRRELDEDVVRVLEDIEGFSLAMHALAYGEADYDWKLRDRSGQPMHERGQLLHKYKPPTARNSYWRLRVEPAGRRAADGRVYEDTGNVALPESYQLSAQVGEPDLLQAFVQLLVARRDLRDRREVNIMRIEDTLRRMMREHAEQWRNRSDKEKGWSPLPRTARDAQLLDEAHDLAAQIIRLSAFIAQAEAELNRHPWAWKQAGRPPEAMEESERVQTQRYVDLWTALRAVALREVAALERRFRELADWNGPKPIERIDIDSGVASEPLPPTPKGETEADEAPADADIDIVPVEMASPTAAKPTTNGNHDPRIDKLEAKLRDLENERSEGFINEDEYQEASAALRAEIAQLKPPAPPATPPTLTTPATPSDRQAQLDKLVRREQRLRDELDDGDISQADYERRMADIARERTGLEASKQSTTISAEDARAAITKLTRREKRTREAFEDGEIDQAEFDRRIAEIANELIRLEAALRSPPRMSAEERQAALDKLARRERRLKEAFDDAEIDQAEYDRRIAEIAQERQALEDVVLDN